MITTDIYYDTGLRIEQQVQLLAPLLQSWIGDEYQAHYYPDLDYYSYRPSGKFLIALGRNNNYQETDEDQDRFRYKLTYIDMEEINSDEENLNRIKDMLQVLWANDIPTCAPFLAEKLPFNGGEDGPVEWPGL